MPASAKSLVPLITAIRTQDTCLSSRQSGQGLRHFSSPTRGNPEGSKGGSARGCRVSGGGHLQIIAAAGSGKTEVVSQQVAALLARRTARAGIVAFTFTERAAASPGTIADRTLRRRRTAPRRTVSSPAPGAMFVGTIHLILLHEPLAAARREIRDLRTVARRQPAHRVPHARGLSPRHSEPRLEAPAVRLNPADVPHESGRESRTSC